MNNSTKIFRCIFVCILVFAIFLIFLQFERPVEPKDLKKRYDNTTNTLIIENVSSKKTNAFSKLTCQIYIDELNYKNLEFDIGPHETIRFDLNNHFSNEILGKKNINLKFEDSTTFVGGTIVLILAISIMVTSLAIFLKKL